MIELTRNDVEEIALLARLGLNNEELERLRSDMGKILSYMEQLQELDTGDVAPLMHPAADGSGGQNLRSDRVEESLPVAVALACAAESADDCFRVPNIIKKST